MTAVAQWLSRHPLWSLTLVFALSAGAAVLCIDPASGKLRIRIDASIDRLLPPLDEDRAVYDRARLIFGDSEVVLAAVTLGPVFTAENLARIAVLTERFMELPGASHVFSLATAPNLQTVGDDIDVRTFTQQAELDPTRLPQFEQQLAANPLYSGALVSADGRTAAFAINLVGVDEDAFRAADYPGRIRAIVHDVTGSADVWITGNPVLKAATTDALLQTLERTIPMILAVMAVMLWLAFRSIRSVVVCVVAVLLAVLWTLATASALGLDLNLVTVIVPPLVLTLGFTYAIHVLSEYLTHHETGAERIAQTLQQITVPVSLSFATTVIGFMAFVASPLPAIQQFGILSVAGVGFAAVLALVFIPAALSLIGSTRRRALPGDAWFAAASKRLVEFDLRRRLPILAVGIILIPAGLWLASGIRAGSEYTRDFSAESQVRRDYEAINSAFNGANLISILIETHVNDALTDPALMREIAWLQDWLREQPEVGATVSYVDHFKLINQSLNGGGAEARVIPESAQTVKQVLIFGGSEDINRTIDARLRSAMISVRINVDGSRPISDLVKRIEQRLAQLPPPLNARVTGSAVVATRTVGDIVAGQAQSILIAVAGIWLLLALMFTSIRAGLLAMLPTLVPVAVYFGTLGLTGVNLSPTTSLIACIVLGVTVDEAFHFLARFNRDARESASETKALQSALSSVLRPVSLNALALCLGFLAFATGELRNQVQFGVLAAFTLFIAWIAYLTLLPALGSLMRIVTLWDILRLDLGRSPQHTIPLLSGLSLRQARIFALTSRMEHHNAGSRVITHGDPSRDMYVIVDGELEAWVDRDGARRSLSKMNRGAVLGETGFFGQRRTANVDTLSEARLLRFDSQDLERLRNRYPRIAATVFRNLNRIQAERLARTTAMLQ